MEPPPDQDDEKDAEGENGTVEHAPTIAVPGMHVFFDGPKNIASELDIALQERGIIKEVKDNIQL